MRPGVFDPVAERSSLPLTARLVVRARSGRDVHALGPAARRRHRRARRLGGPHRRRGRPRDRVVRAAPGDPARVGRRRRRAALRRRDGELPRLPRWRAGRRPRGRLPAVRGRPHGACPGRRRPRPRHSRPQPVRRVRPAAGLQRARGDRRRGVAARRGAHGGPRRQADLVLVDQRARSTRDPRASTPGASRDARHPPRPGGQPGERPLVGGRAGGRRCCSTRSPTGSRSRSSIPTAGDVASWTRDGVSPGDGERSTSRSPIRWRGGWRPRRSTAWRHASSTRTAAPRTA